MKRFAILALLLISSLALPYRLAAQQTPTEKRLRILEQKVDQLYRHLGIQPETPPEVVGNVNLQFGEPACSGTILSKEFYVICYENDRKIPEWVTYHLSAENLKGTASRKDDFRPDPALPKGQRAELSDYRNSGYDRGHMAPAADFKRSNIAMSETFLLSNMSPQTPNLNRRTWAELEDEVRSLANSHGNIWIFTGSLFLDSNEHPTVPTTFIGTDRVAVPTNFYKVILCQHSPDTYEMFAFVLPNQRAVLSGTPRDYIVTVKNVQQLSGLDFFSALPDDIENRLEGMKATDWPIQ